MFFQTSALIALATCASAHLILHSPVPFDFEDTANQQAPLSLEQFPCKQPGGTYAFSGSMNTVAAGGTITAQVQGGATHGGGSCQFSITTDTKPTKDSQWKVLHSQIHGCVGGPANENLSGDPYDMHNPKIPVKIPDDLPAGTYTFAWSWLNKLGNREFYMNCAPLEVTNSNTGSADVSSVLGSLPDMFVANLPFEECTVETDQDFVYPNPGDSVATGEGAMPGTAISGGGCAAQTLLGAGAGKLGAPAEATGAPSAGEGDSAPAPSASAPAAVQPPVSQPGDDSSNDSTPDESTPTVPQPAASVPVVSAPSATPPATAPSTGSGNSSSGDCTPCTTDGEVVCIGDDSFGLCNFGCATPQKLAPGMSCASGAILRRSVEKVARRHARHISLHKRRISNFQGH